jgi:hypothetical protein
MEVESDWGRLGRVGAGDAEESDKRSAWCQGAAQVQKKGMGNFEEPT